MRLNACTMLYMAKWVKITMSIDKDTADALLQLKANTGFSWNDILANVARAQIILNKLNEAQQQHKKEVRVNVRKNRSKN